MEKKYMVGVAKLPMVGDTQVVFDDLKEIQQTENSLEFHDVDGYYKFVKEGNIWHEVDDKAPDLSEYKIVGRRTARRHDLVGDSAQRTEVKPGRWRQEDRAQSFMQRVDNALRSIGFYNDEDDQEEDEIESLYHDASEDELRNMSAFDNLNDED